MQKESYRSETRSGPDRFFDLWLQQSLGGSFDATLSETLPEALLRAIGEDTRKP